MTMIQTTHIPITGTVRTFMQDWQNTQAGSWVGSWFPHDWTPASVIVATPNRKRDVKSLDVALPDDVQMIGWTGLDTSGMCHWLGWDLDSSEGGHHGIEANESLGDCILQAIRFRNYLIDSIGGFTEIRYSKSGSGVHIRHKLRDPLPKADALKFAKLAIHSCKRIHDDPAARGRQTFWMWSRYVGEKGFEVIDL